MKADTILEKAAHHMRDRAATVTTDESGRAVAVTRQDDDHRILSVIWEAPPVAAPVRLTDTDFNRLYDEAGFDPNEMREAAEHMFNAIQSAVLIANGFDIQPTEAEG